MSLKKEARRRYEEEEKDERNAEKQKKKKKNLIEHKRLSGRGVWSTSIEQLGTRRRKWDDESATKRSG